MAIVLPAGFQYTVVPGSAALQAVNAVNPKAGDYLHRIIVNVTAATNNNFSVFDGNTNLTSVAAPGAAGAFPQVGLLTFEIGLYATSPLGWRITTNTSTIVTAIWAPSAQIQGS